MLRIDQADMKLNLCLLILLGQCRLMFSQLYEYHYIIEDKNWTEAQQYCREKHTELATLTNMTDMKRLINISVGNLSEAWIGLYDQTVANRTWRWSLPGVEFNAHETQWNGNEPDDRKIENCGFILKELKWGDISCNGTRHFLCYNESDTSAKFHMINQKKTWLEAQSYCRDKHTDLISGVDQVQDEQLSNLLNSTNESYLFMGLFRDTWRWSDESSFSFRHWNKKFDDEQYNSGQCAMTVFGDEGRWKNEDCTVKKPFICYDDKLILIKENKTWEDALYFCRDHYHDLVTITNLDEQRWVQEKAKKALSPLVWMGLRYTCTLDFWFWVSDEVVSYKNWASDGPMDDCDMSGAMDAGGQHQWFKTFDLMEFNFVCSMH